MKSIKLLSFATLLLAIASCGALQNATNTTTSGIFSLNGKWQLSSNSPENTLLNTVVTVSILSSEGKITTLQNNTQCYREGDVKWKNIKTDNAHGYTIDNMMSNCTSGGLSYQPAAIMVISNNEIRISGKNVAGQDNVQEWIRLK